MTAAQQSRPVIVAVGVLPCGRCPCCDTAVRSIVVGDTIVCVVCWSEFPTAGVLTWQRAGR